MKLQIHLTTQEEIVNMITILYEEPEMHFRLTNASQSRCVDAKSFLGVLYCVSEFPEQLYLWNDTKPGFFPTKLYERYAVKKEV